MSGDRQPCCRAAALCSQWFLRKPEVKGRGHLPGVSLQLDRGPLGTAVCVLWTPAGFSPLYGLLSELSGVHIRCQL